MNKLKLNIQLFAEEGVKLTIETDVKGTEKIEKQNKALNDNIKLINDLNKAKKSTSSKTSQEAFEKLVDSKKSPSKRQSINKAMIGEIIGSVGQEIYKPRPLPKKVNFANLATTKKAMKTLGSKSVRISKDNQYFQELWGNESYFPDIMQGLMDSGISFNKKGIGKAIMSEELGDSIEKTQTLADKFNKVKSIIDLSVYEVVKFNNKIQKSIKDIITLPTKVKKFFENMADTINKNLEDSMDYIEQLHLLEVAYGNTAKEGKKFVNQFAEMTNLDLNWVTKTTAMFRQMSNSLGLSAEKADKFTKALMNLDVDISSLYNISLDDATAKLKSALAGRSTAVQSLGASTQISTLQDFLDDRKISVSISKLNVTEKRILAIAALMNQLKNASGDWAKTLEQPANQIKILRDQTVGLAREIGNALLPAIKKVLPVINGIVMALKMLVHEIALFFGYKVEDNAGMGITDYLDDIESSASSATEGVNKLKHSLRGFDKLNNITSSATSGTGIGSSTGINDDIWDLFLKEYDEYNKKIEYTKSKATEIRDAILEWLGFTVQTNKETGELSLKYEGTNATIELIRKALVLVWDIVKTVIDTFVNWFKSESGQKALNSIKESIDKIFNAIQPVIDILQTLWDTVIGPLFQTKLTTLLNDITYLLNEVVCPAVEALADAFKSACDQIELDIIDLKQFLGLKLTDEEMAKIGKDAALTLIEEAEEENKKYVEGGLIDRALILLKKQFGLDANSKLLKNIGREKALEIIQGGEEKTKESDFWSGFTKGFLNGIKASISPSGAAASTFKDIGKNVTKGIEEGLASEAGNTNSSGFKSFKDKFMNSIKKVLGIASPSKLMIKAKIGNYVTQGIEVGMEDEFDHLDNIAKDFITELNKSLDRNIKIEGDYGYNPNKEISSNMQNYVDTLNNGNVNAKGDNSIYNIYLDKDHKIATYTLQEMQSMAKTNGKPITIAG